MNTSKIGEKPIKTNKNRVKMNKQEEVSRNTQNPNKEVKTKEKNGRVLFKLFGWEIIVKKAEEK